MTIFEILKDVGLIIPSVCFYLGYYWLSGECAYWFCKPIVEAIFLLLDKRKRRLEDMNNIERIMNVKGYNAYDCIGIY